ncbi:hypothetical protein BFR04_05100 [Gaetbulibacter sp. 4G1]|nr:hypothetical protein BFR04_05100 [Gaetbulibacter sp. 4G1]
MGVLGVTPPKKGGVALYAISFCGAVPNLFRDLILELPISFYLKNYHSWLHTKDAAAIAYAGVLARSVINAKGF